jgi:hypothetical protein
MCCLIGRSAISANPHRDKLDSLDQESAIYKVTEELENPSVVDQYVQVVPEDVAPSNSTLTAPQCMQEEEQVPGPQQPHSLLRLLPAVIFDTQSTPEQANPLSKETLACEARGCEEARIQAPATRTTGANGPGPLDGRGDSELRNKGYIHTDCKERAMTSRAEGKSSLFSGLWRFPLRQWMSEAGMNPQQALLNRKMFILQMLAFRHYCYSSRCHVC